VGLLLLELLKQVWLTLYRSGGDSVFLLVGPFGKKKKEKEKKVA